jgi:uncharacterized phiE125 gp8 family phage protein
MTVTLAQAKAQCRVRHDDENDYITGLIAAAKAWVERYTMQPTAVSTVVETFNEFGDYIPLGYSPFSALTSIAYVDADGEDAEVADARVQDGRIYAPVEAGWPAITGYSTITVTYQAGYATTPPDLDHAMLLLIGHWYANREAVALGDAANEIPFAVEALAGPFRTPTLR